MRCRQQLSSALALAGSFCSSATEELDAATESDADSETEDATAWLAQVTATLDATHVDVNHDGAEEDDFDVEQYIKDSMAASFATDDFTAQFWA